MENLPYGFKDTDFDLAADYRITRRIKGSIGYDYDKIERNLQARFQSRVVIDVNKYRSHSVSPSIQERY